MEKRLIKDYEVMRRISSQDIDVTRFVKNNVNDEALNGYVASDLSKVRLSGNNGLTQFVSRGITDSLISKYNSIRIEDEECTVSFGEKGECVVDANTMRLLKALCLEQRSKSIHYSTLIAKYFLHVLYMSTGCGIQLHSEDLEARDLVIVKALNKFISDRVCPDYIVIMDNVIDTVDVDDDGDEVLDADIVEVV